MTNSTEKVSTPGKMAEAIQDNLKTTRCMETEFSSGPPVSIAYSYTAYKILTILINHNYFIKYRQEV